MMKRALTPALLGLACLAMPKDAFALSCDEIMNMVNVGVPSSIVVQTMEGSGDQFSDGDIACLTSKGAPADVLATANAMKASSSEPDPIEVGNTSISKPPRKSDDFEDDDILGGSVDRRSGTYGQDELSDGDAEEATSPAVIEDAIELYRAKKPLSASKILWEVLEDGTFPDQEAKLQYYLARCLYDLEMYHSAQHYFIQVLRKGPRNPYFKYALPKLVAIARYTGDDTDLARIVPKIPPDQYPRKAKNHLYYLMGVRLFDQEQLSEAHKYFSQISTKSDLYLKSKYFDGVIYNKQGRLKSAVKAFRDVIRDAEGIDIYSERELEEVDALTHLSLMNVARIYYSIQRFDESAKYYDLVPHDSPYWPKSLWEAAYANFLQNDLNLALGQILTIRSPFYNTDEYLPEATVLRALIFFNLCEYDEVERELLAFEDATRPVHAELKDFTERFRSSEGKKLADQAYEAYYVENRRDSYLTKSILSSFLDNTDFAGLQRHLELMDSEEQLIDSQKAAWSGTVGEHLKKVIASERQEYRRRAGQVLLAEMADLASYLEDLLTQSEIIRFEVVSAQRADYAYKMSNPDLADALDANQIDFATSIDFIYWPFNGEFWKDELGYYHYTEQGSCK